MPMWTHALGMPIVPASLLHHKAEARRSTLCTLGRIVIEHFGLPYEIAMFMTRELTPPNGLAIEQ
eukprot:1149435-Pelagomonas_calceolata.AAC.8